MSDFGSGLEQYGPRHELSGRATKADLRRRIAALEAENAELRAVLKAIHDNPLGNVEELQAEIDAAQAEARAWKWLTYEAIDSFMSGWFKAPDEDEWVAEALTRYQPTKGGDERAG